MASRIASQLPWVMLALSSGGCSSAKRQRRSGASPKLQVVAHARFEAAGRGQALRVCNMPMVPPV